MKAVNFTRFLFWLLAPTLLPKWPIYDHMSMPKWSKRLIYLFLKEILLYTSNDCLSSLNKAHLFVTFIRRVKIDECPREVFEESVAKMCERNEVTFLLLDSSRVKNCNGAFKLPLRRSSHVRHSLGAVNSQWAVFATSSDSCHAFYDFFNVLWDVLQLVETVFVINASHLVPFWL